MSRMLCLTLGGVSLSAWVLLLGCLQAPSSSKPISNSQASAEHAADDGHEHSDEHQDAQAADDSASSEIEAALAELSSEDRVAAYSQKFCAVNQTSLLGGMGPPVKLEIEGQSVFLCCEGCRKKALKDPAATLAAVAKLKQANATTP